MAAPASTESFLDLVRKSTVLDDDILDSYLDQKQQLGALPAGVEQLARQLVEDGLLSVFQAEQLLQGKWRGFTLGRYRILERLGKGGMGMVYLAEHQVMRHRAALKVLPKDQAGNSGVLKRFQREARAAAALHHNNLVHAFDFDSQDGMYFLVMEYVDGINLQNLVERRGGLGAARAANYIRQTAIGLQYAFETAGLIHRDIKPANLLLDRSGTVKILDMGLARFFHDKADELTRNLDDNAILGTADYIAPEQAVDSHDVDIRADIYGLGATFYYLLAGRPPFLEGSLAQKLLWHQLREPQPVEQLVPGLPAGLAAVVRKMMAKEKEERYQTPGEVVAALEPWAATALVPPEEEYLPRLCRAAQGSRSGGTAPAPPDSSDSSSTDCAIQSKQETYPDFAPAPTGAAADRQAITTDGPPSDLIRGFQESDQLGVQPEGQPRRRRRQRRLWPGALAAVVCVLGAGLGVGIYMASSPSMPFTSTPGSTGPGGETAVKPASGVVLVPASGPEQACASVQDAWTKANPGDRIKVKADNLREKLILNRKVKDVVLEGDSPSGKPVVWQYPAPPGATLHPPLLQVHNQAGLQVKGFVFDGQDCCEDVILVVGECPGLRFENLYVLGFIRSAVRLFGAVGTSQQPIVLTQLRLQTSDLPKPQEADSLITLTASKGQTCKQIQLTDCRLEGPAKALVLVEGAVADVLCERDRFFNGGDGLFFKKVANAPTSIQGLTVFSCTFCSLKTGLHWESFPDAKTPDRLAMQNNLLINVGRMAHAEGVRTEPTGNVTAHWIWHEEAKEGTKADLPAESRYFRKEFAFDGKGTQAILNIACDDHFEVWLNGKEVGQSGPYYNKRVYAFEVTPLLRQGDNLLAVQATNHKDLANAALTPAALLVWLTDTVDGKPRTLAESDRSWWASNQGPAGWNTSDFEDLDWPAAHDQGIYNRTRQGIWHNLVWDSVVQPRPGTPSPILITATDNIRNLGCGESWPFLNARAGNFNLNTQPGDDLTFLRYPANSPLALLGANNKPVGVPPPPVAGK